MVGRGEIDPYLRSGRLNDSGNIIKYFLHGLAFSLIMLALAFGGVILILGMAICGACLGIAIAIAILVYLVGWINNWLMEVIWGMHKTGDDWWQPFGHGLVLLIVLFVLGLPNMALNTILPDDISIRVMVSIVMFLIYCFIDGYAAYKIGGMFTQEFHPASPPTATDHLGPPPLSPP